MAADGPRTPRPTREFPREPYPGLSLVGVAALALVAMALLGLFGITAIGLAGASPIIQLAYGGLCVLAVAMPLVGIRALFGPHLSALLALTVLVGLFFGGFVAADPVGAAPFTVLAVFPVAVATVVTAFAWWKYLRVARQAR